MIDGRPVVYIYLTALLEGLRVVAVDDDADGGSGSDRYASFYQGWQVRSLRLVRSNQPVTKRYYLTP